MPSPQEIIVFFEMSAILQTLSSTWSTLATEDDEVIDFEAIATLHLGVVEGAVFALAMPRLVPWNSCLLIYAHGFRAPETPLHAEVDDPFWWRLVKQGSPSPFARSSFLKMLLLSYSAELLSGWAVGVTSYRRSGIVVGDAIRDINNFRNYVCNEFAPPYFCFVDGRSMGGAVRSLPHGV